MGAYVRVANARARLRKLRFGVIHGIVWPFQSLDPNPVNIPGERNDTKQGTITNGKLFDR
jgi:hypothetical protein